MSTSVHSKPSLVHSIILYLFDDDSSQKRHICTKNFMFTTSNI